ncbi:MAG: energy transducer TonB [Flavobacterium sp.]
MKLIKIFLFVLLPMAGFSQIQGEDEVYLGGDRIEAKFNGGGLEKFNEYLNKEFDYSKVTKPGRLEAAFTVDEQGNVTKIRIIQVLDVESATEFIRVLKKCPKWEPAKRNGKPISIEIKYPMVFKERTNESVEVVEDVKSDSDEKTFEMSSVEVKPAYAGGLKKFYEFVAKNFHMPDVEGLGGKVLVSFIVDKDGSLTNIKVIKDIGYGTGIEVIRVLKLCPKWNPATQNGVPVRCEYRLPISLNSR